MKGKSLLRCHCNSDLDAEATISHVDQYLSLVAALRCAMTALDERSADILSKRLGFEGHSWSAQDVAAHHSLTYERIRQIDVQAFSTIRSHSAWEGTLLQAIRRVANMPTKPTTVLSLITDDPWFADVSEDGELLKNLLQRLQFGYYVIDATTSNRLLTRIDETRWRRAIEVAKLTLESAAQDGEDWSIQQCRSTMSALISDEAPELTELLWEAVSSEAHFATVAGASRLVSYGNTVSSLVEAVLREASEPLHYSSITRRVELLVGLTFNEGTIRNHLHNAGILYGRGYYGTLAQLGISSIERAELAAWLEAFVEVAPSRQWTCNELLPPAKQQLPFSDRLTIYVINAVLPSVPGACDLGRYTWTFTEDETKAPSRIDLREAVESLLDEAGHPLEGDVIRERLAKTRGIKPNQQIVQHGRVFRCNRTTWGLLDRDAGLNSAERDILYYNLEELLTHANTALHLAEISKACKQLETRRLLEGLDDDEFSWRIFGLAQKDLRFKVTRGLLLYLSAWEGPRRLTVRGAVQQIVAEIPDSGISLRQIQERTVELVGREIDLMLISTSLQGIARWNETQGLWFRDTLKPSRIERGV